MQIPLDIHTHNIVSPCGRAVVNLFPKEQVLKSDVYYSVGIHPWYVEGQTWQKQLDIVRRYMCFPQVVALGECGLDKVCVKALPENLRQETFELQIKAFEAQILLSESVNKPLIIHCVKAYNELVELKRKYRPRQPWLLHGFRGNVHVAQTLLAEGCYFSFGEYYQPAVLQQMPRERIFVETDESKKSLDELLLQAALCCGVTVEELKKQLCANYLDVFR